MTKQHFHHAASAAVAASSMIGEAKWKEAKEVFKKGLARHATFQWEDLVDSESEVVVTSEYGEPNIDTRPRPPPPFKRHSKQLRDIERSRKHDREREPLMQQAATMQESHTQVLGLQLAHVKTKGSQSSNSTPSVAAVQCTGDPMMLWDAWAAAAECKHPGLLTLQQLKYAGALGAEFAYLVCRDDAAQAQHDEDIAHTDLEETDKKVNALNGKSRK